MNLFRDDVDVGLDNYSTLVRPFVEQRYTNQRVGGQIRGLQHNSRTQSSSIKRIGQTAEGVATPQFYQNFKGFYPALNK